MSSIKELLYYRVSSNGIKLNYSSICNYIYKLMAVPNSNFNIYLASKIKAFQSENYTYNLWLFIVLMFVQYLIRCQYIYVLPLPFDDHVCIARPHSNGQFRFHFFW